LPASLKPGTILKEQPNKETLEGHIASLLIKIAKTYQVPNFDEETALLLAIDTIDRYQYDPVDVLVKCLERPPSTGQKNWRLTPDTISEWMGIALEREADRLERAHQNKKTEKAEIEANLEISQETEKMVKDYINSLSDFKKVAPLPEGYEKEYGRREPKKVSHSAGYVQPSEQYIFLGEAKRTWALENTDLITGKRLQNSTNFDDWIKNHHLPQFAALAEAKRLWALENTDLLTGKTLPNSPSFEDWIKK
jgi:hypothetical protein